jgi:hypothetical protein
VNFPGLQGNNITLANAFIITNSTSAFSQRAASGFSLPTTGGLSLPGVYSLHCLSANGVGIISPTYGDAYDIAGRWPVVYYPINYAYEDPRLFNFDGQTQDTNGNAWLLLPDGVTNLYIRPSAPSVVFCSNNLTDNGKYPPAHITNQCVFASPAPRTRTNIGVGEQVNLGLAGAPPGNLTWSTSAGTLETNGANIILTAPDTSNMVIVTVTYSGGSCSTAFLVIQPSGYLLENSNVTSAYCPPTNSNIYLEYSANVYVQPDTVNFGNISNYESGAIPITQGYYTNYSNRNHSANGPNGVTSNVVAGKGTLTIGDIIGGGGVPPYSNGQFTWPIQWSYSVGAGSTNVVQTINEIFTLAVTNGQTNITVQKGNSGYHLSSSNSIPAPN